MRLLAALLVLLPVLLLAQAATLLPQMGPLTPLQWLAIIGSTIYLVWGMHALFRGIVAITLLMHGEVRQAVVVERFLRLGVLDRIRYEFGTAEGSSRGVAPGTARVGERVAVRHLPGHPDWHRPDRLLGDDVLAVLSLGLAPLLATVLHGLRSIWPSRGKSS